MSLDERKALDAKEATMNADAILEERMRSLNQAKRIKFLEKGKNEPQRVKPTAKKDGGPEKLFNLGFWGHAEKDDEVMEGVTTGKALRRSALAARLAAKLVPAE